jgi:hypothetical protein
VRISRWSLPLGAALLAVTASLAASPALANASGPEAKATSPNQTAEDRVIENSYAAQDIILALTAADRANYGSIRMDTDTGLIEVRWKGHPPATLTHELAAKGLQDAVTILPAQFSESELTAAVRAWCTRSSRGCGRDHR